MINHHDMFFSFVRNIVFFQKHLKRILIHFFLKPTAQLFMELHSKPKKGPTFFWI